MGNWVKTSGGSQKTKTYVSRVLSHHYGRTWQRQLQEGGCGSQLKESLSWPGSQDKRSLKWLVTSHPQSEAESNECLLFSSLPPQSRVSAREIVLPTMEQSSPLQLTKPRQSPQAWPKAHLGDSRFCQVESSSPPPHWDFWILVQWNNMNCKVWSGHRSVFFQVWPLGSLSGGWGSNSQASALLLNQNLQRLRVFIQETQHNCLWKHLLLRIRKHRIVNLW